MVQHANAVEVTAAGILNDLELDFKLAVVAARLGHNGIMQLIDGWIRDAGRAATRAEPEGGRCELDARWPSPPTPWITTRSPGLAPQLHSALKVVTPAHNNGADSTASSSSDTLASAEASASMCVV